MPALRLLVFVQQRHPLIVQEAADEISRADTDIQERVDSVMTSLSLAVAPPPSASASEAGVGSLVASMSADEHARTAADNAVEQQPIRAALVARVQDTSAVVLNALYAARAALLPVFLAAPKPYLDSLAAALAGKPKRPLLHLHLGFPVGPLSFYGDSGEPENSTSTNLLLTVKLLAEIFSYLKDDALAFLAGVWTTSWDSTTDLCVLALRHAVAFLEAHNKEADGTRTAALDCIAVQRSLAEQRFSAGYAFDAIYGESEAKLERRWMWKRVQM
ncbi:hypothetical protein B0H14DRAFT_3898709 [Mycena olivaceomarginata]|nr:hypothetical protein B0H14DRAFT_3898709 [Mycena olivaceomarginata]